MIKRFLVAVLCAASAAGLLRAEPPAPDLNPALLELLDADYDALLRADPISASNRGEREYDRLLPDVSPAGIEAFRADAAKRLARLESLDAATMSADDRLNADLLRLALRERLEEFGFHPEWTPVSGVDGPQISLPQIAARLSFATRSHFEDYLERLRAIPGHIDQHIENMRAGLRAGVTPPRVVMSRVAEQARAVGLGAFAERPEAHPLYQPFLSLPEGDGLRAAALEAVREGVVPAFSRLAEFLEREYVPNCRDTIAATDRPDGEAYYAQRVRSYTTTPLTAREIHELGLSEVSRIRAEMMGVIARSDYPRKDELEGDALFRAFLAYLRTDSRFYHDDPEALLAGYRDICKRMDAELPLLFGRLPRLPYGVREMPRFMAASAPTAFYYPGSMKGGVAGTFIANTHRLDQRPKYEMIALALHEAVPGHHLQFALATELEETGLPKWRSLFYSTVYIEGWALYAEKLGLEVGGTTQGSVFGGGTGLYEDPYDDFGRLSYEMWRALRLVVDTGIHALGWTRERAVDYMLANSALTRQNVESEVDRYIAWPGQALAYKIGELKKMEMRRLAERELGDRFDRRAFHDAILETGPVPLDVLERRMRSWIESRRSAD